MAFMPAKTITARPEHMTPAQARRLFTYNQRLFERYARFARRLPWEDAIRNRETGHQSLFATLVHILQVHEVWICYIMQHRDTDEELEKLFEDPARKPKDWEQFQRYQRRVWKGVNRFLAGLTPRAMSRTVHAFWMPGKYVLSDGLMQTTFEQAHHIGEFIGALWQQDVKPPDMTWIEIGRSLSRK